MDESNFYRNITILKKSLLLVLFESNDKKGILKFQKHLMPSFVHLVQKLRCIHKKNDFNLPEYKIENIYKGICKITFK